MSTTVVVMGVAGSGKTVVGSALAEELGWAFVDADDHHPPANVDKMRSGIPLTDADREPWLAALNDIIRAHQARDEDLVLACSALTRAYRARLGEEVDDLRIAFLDISPEVAAERLRGRRGHFMPSTLIDSQFATLEPPVDAEVSPVGGIAEIVRIDASRPLDEVVATLAAHLATATG